ncbi:MAG: hypothetical protein A3J55_01685 [Candidatus Ryanbacteria bacterium RIFCSPHIGHO2_02_FULL_45_17b]|uniref:Trigger factor n=1 Tax=Candidatus Ryanbacteria bacterium RIFCSPHIGHO2_01_FULL_45_22 TaxID=1802114 RepID=A0A1G2G1R4_9BACT|nr:MAG: hypothetical protein A2719_02540 [Candidatus Ryanbacteria bacterium RIFCSPHIGHO2_01_FULL_45_22]OGZ47827.1 MAG: hypothetical protein A3J55_01685 [Candidatus Ryanbacteria bacterium RIFCSPHIGHO2_02_FULL_45_17b]
MQIEVTKKPKSTVTIKGSLSADEFNVHIQHVTRRFVESAELPGFRKGKAPERMVLEKIGEGTLLEEAAEEALRTAYPVILKEHSIDAIGRPQVRITKLARQNPLEFEADIAVLPEVSLPDYKNIAKTLNAKPKEEIVVSEEELEKSLDWLRKSRAKKTAPPNDEKNAEEASLPELTDEFAQSLGAYKTVEELKNVLRENIKLEKEQKAHDKRRMELLEAVSEASTMEISDMLVESEKDKMYSELKAQIEQIGMQWDMYLTHIKKKEEELRNEWQSDAEKRVRSAMVLREIAKNESIEPTEDELNAWAYQYLAQTEESEKKNLDLERVKDYAYGVIRNKKVLEFLENQ